MLLIDGDLAGRYDFREELVEIGSGMSVSFLRRLVCFALIATLPSYVLGQGQGAILHSQGGVWVNGYEAKDSSAIFSGDSLETKAGFSATLTLDGTSILLAPETLGKFDGDVFVLDHGNVAVETSRSFKIRVKCITVTPVVNEFTKYEVSDITPTMQVAARKLDVNVQGEMKEKKAAQEPGAETSRGGIVHETEQKSYDETSVCGAPPITQGTSSGISPKWYAIGGGAAGLVLLVAILGHGGGNNKCKAEVSQTCP